MVEEREPEDSNINKRAGVAAAEHRGNRAQKRAWRRYVASGARSTLTAVTY